MTIVRRLSGKKSPLNQSEFTTTTASTTESQQLEQYTISSDSQQSIVNSGFCSFVENRLKMQPTSNLDDLENVDLTTENLPAVDTPDACDKAALRCVQFLFLHLICCQGIPPYFYRFLMEPFQCGDHKKNLILYD